MPVDHYENFPVASLLLPKKLRRPIEAIYRFARSADDIADEGDASDEKRLQGLDAYHHELERIAQALQNGIRLFQIRDKTLPDSERLRFAQGIMDLAAELPDTCILVNDDEQLTRTIGASGLHLSSGSLHALDRRPDFDRIAASCHTGADLERAANLDIDFVVLSPVLPTASHPEATGMGWDTFGQFVEHLTIPVYALGGMRQEMLVTAKAHGAHGIALMRGW